MEDVVREDRPVEALPAPAGGIFAEPGAENLQGASEARRLKRRARFDLRRAAVVAPRRVAAQRIDQEAAARRSAGNVAELVFRHARELDEPGRVDRGLDGLRRHLAVPFRKPAKRTLRRGVGSLRARQQRQQSARLQRDAVELDRRDVVGRQPPARLDSLRDPRRPERLDPGQAEGIRILRGSPDCWP